MQKEYRLRAVTFILGLIILAAGIVSGQEVQESPQAKKERIEAERLWEQMIRVKGGREKLHSISNMMLTKGNKPDNIQIQFYVYPNKYWEWNKDKDFYNYLFVKMANLDLGVFFVASHDGIAKHQKDLNDLQRANYREAYLMGTCTFLLETKWLQPTPILVTRKTVGKKQFDVVETHFPNLKEYWNWRQDFFIEPETLEVHGVEEYGDDGKSYGFYSFEGYTTVNGIQVPQKFTRFSKIKDFKKRSYTPLNFQFDIEYNEKLFERPPSAEAGADAWKPQKSMN